MGLLLLALAVPVVFFAAARFAEYFIGSERRFGAVRVRVHGPEISLGLSVRADSATVLAPGFRLDLFKPSVHLVGGFRLDPSGATLVARADSAFFLPRPSTDTSARPLVFPANFRFPLSARLEWRALTVRAREDFDLEVGEGRLRSRGAYGAEGGFTLRTSNRDPRAPEARVEVSARWTGDLLRYRAVARGDARRPALRRDSLRVAGARDKRDLRLGADTVTLASARPADWLPPEVAAHLPDVARLRASGSADWRTRNLKVTGAASTGEWRFLRPCDWTFDARLEAEGGRLALAGEGGGQTFRATGSWSHPEAWLRAPEWKQCEAEVSAETRGVEWKIGRFTLPIEFSVPSATLRSGLDAKARVVTRDGSELDLKWNGRRPGRLEFSGPVSPAEAWAVAWTDSQLYYRQAFVRGSWEDGRVRVSGDFRDVLAYGAEADSVHAENEISRRQYTLRSATIHKGGESYTGSGWVRWFDDADRHAVSLRFEAHHPEYGSGFFAMPRLGRLEARAVNLRAARFPYKPLQRFAAFDPWVEGTFDWELHGGGAADLNASLTGGRNLLRGRLLADWTRDSLRVAEGELASGAARVSARGALPLEGKSLFGLSGLRTFAGGTWRLGVDSLRAGDVFALFGKASRPVEGDLHGALEYSPALGLRGAMRLDSVHVHALREHVEIGGVSLIGMGDSVSVTLAASSKRFPGLVDTVRAMVSGFDSAGPRFWARTRSATGPRVEILGSAPGWTMVSGTARVEGALPLGGRAGVIDSLALDGDFSTTLGRGLFKDLAFEGRTLRARYTVAGETQTLAGKASYASGQLRVSELVLRNARGGAAAGSAEASFWPLAARADLAGERFGLVLPSGQRFEARGFSAKARWRSGEDLAFDFDARSGSFAFPPSPYRVEGQYDNLRLRAVLPSSGPAAPASLAVRGRIHDFLFERKLADRKIERDLGALFNFGRASSARPSSGPRRARPWDLDIDVDAVGARNRVETDVLRMNFIGDMRVKGRAPYLLVTGRVSGLQGEIGQARQAYALRDFEVKWDNAALEEGRISVEGEKRVRVDCRVETKQTCPFYIRVDGRLRDANFTYDTDCGQSTGEQVAPTVLITSMSRGCYAGEASGDGAYGGAALAAIEPYISSQITRGFARGSGGFIKSTQVSGLGAIMGGDSSGLEAVSLEVESREFLWMGLKGKAGYHPETKQASPMEYRMAAEFRPPLARLKDRLTVEAAVETRPETRDIEEERRVQQRLGLRYRYRFWDLW